MFVAPQTLMGKRVLVVEDEFSIAQVIADFLEDFGCTPVGPYGTVANALDAVRTQEFDVAVLDVNLNGEGIYPVAELLAERHVPFLLLTGYGEQALPPDHSDWKVCNKPFKAEQLAVQLESALGDIDAATRSRRA